MTAEIPRVRTYLLQLQDEICTALEAHEQSACFERLVLDGERGGLSRPRVLDGGEVIERAAVHFSHTVGATLPGDQLELDFQAAALPALAPGDTRDWLVRLDGYNKDGDFNNGWAQQVEPLPFHGMSGYPYPAHERYPDDDARRRYRAEWNTRPGRTLVAPLFQ